LYSVEGFEVFADFGDKLFTALVTFWKPFIWCIGLGEGEEGEGGAAERKEMTDVLFYSPEIMYLAGCAGRGPNGVCVVIR
jgi:hypothetical protein